MQEYIVLGGPVLWVIVVLGAMALSVFLERSLHLHRARIDETDFLQGIFNTIRRGNVAEAITLCEETPGPVARLISTAIKRRQSSRQQLMDELDQAGRAEISRMERRLSVLSLIAQVAPLLGLLGTILGILAALISMKTAAPFISADSVTDGLITGAITTAAGLMVSIPCFMGFNVLVVKIDRLVLDMRHACSEALYFFDNAKGGGGHRD